MSLYSTYHYKPIHPKRFAKTCVGKKNEILNGAGPVIKRQSEQIICIYGGKRCGLSLQQKVETEQQERRSRGKEFQTVGAANEKEHLPIDVRIF